MLFRGYCYCVMVVPLNVASMCLMINESMKMLTQCYTSSCIHNIAIFD